MEKRQTAVEWFSQECKKLLVERSLNQIDQPQFEALLDNAASKAMVIEKNQWFNFARQFYQYASGPDSGTAFDSDVQQFYSKTYGK